MRLVLWRTTVKLATSIEAAFERHDERTRLFLRIEHDDTEGFGEIDPQPRTLNGDPGVGEVLTELRDVLLPQLIDVARREGAPPSWTRVSRFAGPRHSSPPAVTLAEMALFDRELRRGGESLASRWPALMSTPLQATTSILGSEMEVEVPTETVRLRVKTQPGSIATGVVTFLERLGQPVLLDFNCSATLDDEVLEQVAMLSTRIEVVGVEQPYAPGNVVDHARLAEQLNVPVSIDEGVRTVRDIEQIARYGAAKIVCVKPARVGGYANARTIIERAKELGLRPYIGGFFESELARSVNRTMAHHLVDEPSDVGPVATSALDADSEFLKVSGGFGLVPTSEFLAKCVLVETLSI